jgi:predicted GH43/DUF377 family glycosyl hydrolase
MKIQKQGLRLTATPGAVITLFLHLPGEGRIGEMVRRVEELSDAQVHVCMTGVQEDFGGRHRHLRESWLDHFHRVEDQYGSGLSHFGMERQLLLGAFFTKEYSIQAAALFNPSMVPHPDQEGLAPDERRFIMSLRATGEGHISSIVFRTGIVDGNGGIRLDTQSGFYTRLRQIGHGGGGGQDQATAAPVDGTGMNYTLGDPSTIPIDEQVLFPHAKGESMGMEDLRLVKFEDKGRCWYYGTYTAYDGVQIQTKLIETEDFYRYRIRTLSGAAVSDKGMALFPEKIGGKFAMISRQGGQHIQLMFSDDLYRWESCQLLMKPKFDWELLQLGNCGSPIKTAKGWLLLTHGVGAMRKYVISAILLKLDDPAQVIGRLDKPFITVEGADREGYVPNVVYTCGAMLHGPLLVIPYAVSDSATACVTLVLDELLKEFEYSATRENSPGQEPGQAKGQPAGEAPHFKQSTKQK